MISLVTVSTARPSLAQRGLIAALRQGLERLVSELSSQGLMVVSNEAAVIELAKDMGLGCLSVSTGGEADGPWPTGAKAGLEWCGHDDKARRGIVLVDAALLIEDRQALERFLAFVASQPCTPVIGMRQTRDHPCQMFSAWNIVDLAIMKAQDRTEAARAGWKWLGCPGQADCRCRVPLGGQAMDAVYFEAFNAGGERLGRRLVEVPMSNEGNAVLSLEWLGPDAASLCAFALRRVFDGAYDLELHFGSVQGLWNLDADSGVILDEKKEQGIFSRQKFPAVFPGNIMAAYFPPEMMSGELPPPLHKFTLLPLNLADADG